MTPWCVVLVYSWRRLLADRHSLPFPWTLFLHRWWCPSTSHHPLTFLFLHALTFPLPFTFPSLGLSLRRPQCPSASHHSFPSHSLGRLCQRLGVGSSPKEIESAKPNINEESVSSMGSNGTTSTVGPKAWSQKRGPKHACGLCCRPMRAKEGAVRCSHGHWMHLKCAGVTVSQAKKVFRSNRVFQCRCRKASPAKWLREKERGTSSGGESNATTPGR